MEIISSFAHVACSTAIYCCVFSRLSTAYDAYRSTVKTSKKLPQEEMLSPYEKVGYKADFNRRGPNHLTSFIARTRRGLLGFNYFLQNSDDLCRLPLDMRSDVGLDVLDCQIDSDRGTASNRVLRRLFHVRVCERKKNELARKRQEKT